MQAAAHGQQLPSSAPPPSQEAPAAMSAASPQPPGSRATQGSAPAALPAAADATAAVSPMVQSNAEGIELARQKQNGGSAAVEGALRQNKSEAT